MSMNSDFEWFVANYDELFKKYGTGYLVIKDERVYGVYDSYGVAVKKAWQEHKPGTVSIQYCDGTESAYTVELFGFEAIM